MSDLETTLEVDRMVPGKELTIRCMDTGTYTRSVLTEGQGGTFIEMEAGNDPTNLSVRMQVAMAGNAALPPLGRARAGGRSQADRARSVGAPDRNEESGRSWTRTRDLFLIREAL